MRRAFVEYNSQKETEMQKAPKTKKTNVPTGKSEKPMKKGGKTEKSSGCGC